MIMICAVDAYSLFSRNNDLNYKKEVYKHSQI